MGKAAVAIDPSGSIGEEELNEFMAKIRFVTFDCRPEKRLLVQCEAILHECIELDPSMSPASK